MDARKFVPHGRPVLETDTPLPKVAGGATRECMAEDSQANAAEAHAGTIIPSATVIVFRHGPADEPELLMLQRSQEMRFAAGATVFPGGKVDVADCVLAAALRPTADPAVTSAQIAAVRETLEEAGLLIGVVETVAAETVREARAMLLREGALAPVLDAFGWTLEPERLTLYAHWQAPMERPFDTHFFIADIGTGDVEIAVDSTENTRLLWLSARRALAMADAGEIDLIFPTRRNLERLAQHSSFAGALDDAARYPVRRIRPQYVVYDGRVRTEIPDGLGYPVLSQDADARSRR
jgi:8-oxo-dGTP pyrophosphatase MutT (NUDIX family)